MLKQEMTEKKEKPPAKPQPAAPMDAFDMLKQEMTETVKPQPAAPMDAFDLLKAGVTEKGPQEQSTDPFELAMQAEKPSLEAEDLPSMDDDLPEMKPIIRVLPTRTLPLDYNPEDEMEYGIEVLHDQSDFDDFFDESSIIGSPKAERQPPVKEAETKAQAPAEAEQKPETQAVTEASQTVQAEGLVSKLKEQVAESLSPKFSTDLSGMIENMIAETIQKTLNDTLPDLMEKIIQEELEDS